MAITDKEKGVWGLDQVYNKINQGSIWDYSGAKEFWAWGTTQEGALANNSQTQYSSPIQISGTTWSEFAKYICGMGNNVNTTQGNRTMFALRTDDTLWGWGQNETGEIPINTDDSYSSPKQVPGSWSSVSTSYYGGIGLKTDGTLWAWGRNTEGQLGQGNTTQRSSPVQIPGTWTTQFQGYSSKSVLAIRGDGTLWAWGNGGFGSLAQNNQTQYSSPRQIPGTDWSHFPAGNSGGNSVQMFKTDGTLWGWGSTSYGQLGQNTSPSGGTERFSSPVQIPGTTWDNVAGGEVFIGHKTDGTLWGMGRNSYGQLGLNSRTLYSSPVQIGSSTDWSSNVFCNDLMAGAVKTDGTLWMWGYDNWGALGLNQGSAKYSSPVQLPGTSWGNPTDIAMSGGTMFFLKNV